jgi:2-polyprenyl-3-methyl-5-hydroxy-6-metoxy-1,4-benzoquinol methylase
MLDIGCGRAYVLFWWARKRHDWDLLGVDCDENTIIWNRQISRALNLPHLNFEVQRAESVIVSTQYDVIISIDVLEHIPDDQATLMAWRGHLKPTGILLIHVPLRHQLQKRFLPVFKQHTVPDHVRDEYTEEEIATKLRLAGFEVLSIAYGFGSLGELAFELNNVFWRRPALRNTFALITFPLALLIGYLDVCFPPRTRGNSLIILARPS